MKKLKIFTVIGSIICIFYTVGCEELYLISVYNNANHNIEVLVSYGNPLFPDTLLPDRFYEVWRPTKPGFSSSLSTGIPYKRYIQSYGSDTIIIFIFHTDTLLEYTWDEVREDYKILKRYDVSWQEMEKLRGNINYPPTKAEKDIRQYPPYEQ